MGNENNLNRPRGRAKRIQILKALMARADPDMRKTVVVDQLNVWELCRSTHYDYLAVLGLE